MEKIISQIKQEHRFREDFLRAELRIGNQVGAISRRLGIDKPKMRYGQSVKEYRASVKGWRPPTAKKVEVFEGVTIPFRQALEVLAKAKNVHEKRMVKLASAIRISRWQAGVKGFGLLGLAQIIGECGPLQNYSTVGKVWKRMGLAVIDGQRQRKVQGDAAIE